MKSAKIIVKSKSKTYPIYFGNEIINTTGKLIQKNLPNVKKVCLISDKNVPLLLLKKLTRSLKKYNPKVYKLSIKEKTKSFGVANKLIESLLKDNFNRSDCIIALGGGVLGDLSAFISSLTKRGVKFINIPSTLLAQADASIGGKTAVNSDLGKNLIGTFYQPDFVLMDTSLLSSLSKREMICGYAEILKHSLILDKKFFLWLTKNAKKIINNTDKNLLKIAVIKSCKIKSKIINKDEKEKNLRMILNFGHTFAHGLEGAKNFSKKLNHGEAVLMGIICASEFAFINKLMAKNDLNLIKNHYSMLNLPSEIKKLFKIKDIKKIIKFMKSDKKNFDAKINLVLIDKIGINAKVKSFKESLIKNYLLKKL